MPSHTSASGGFCQQDTYASFLFTLHCKKKELQRIDIEKKLSFKNHIYIIDIYLELITSDLASDFIHGEYYRRTKRKLYIEVKSGQDICNRKQFYSAIYNLILIAKNDPIAQIKLVSFGDMEGYLNLLFFLKKNRGTLFLNTASKKKLLKKLAEDFVSFYPDTKKKDFIKLINKLELNHFDDILIEECARSYSRNIFKRDKYTDLYEIIGKFRKDKSANFAFDKYLFNISDFFKDINLNDFIKQHDLPPELIIPSIDINENQL